MKVLITAGGTAEPIDGVRRIVNTSTGATGATIARVFAAHGVEVVLLHAEDALASDIDVDQEAFVTFADLEDALRRRLSEDDFDAVIHLAAVSDYSVASIEIDGDASSFGPDGKIASGHEVLVRLTPNPKLQDSLRSWSRNTAIQIVAFKLTNEPDPGVRAGKIRKLLDRGTCDLAVHNDLAGITDDRHEAEVWPQRGPIVRTATHTELAETLLGLLRENPAQDEDEDHDARTAQI